jgi:NhaP-type Na+/H+ or K+/H+ antiporter
MKKKGIGGRIAARENKSNEPIRRILWMIVLLVVCSSLPFSTSTLYWHLEKAEP